MAFEETAELQLKATKKRTSFENVMPQSFPTMYMQNIFLVSFVLQKDGLAFYIIVVLQENLKTLAEF